MKKKRREIENFKTVDLAKQKLTLKSFLSEEIKRNAHCGLLTLEYLVLPEYGKGHITEFHFDGVSISVSNFTFNQNFIFYNQLDINGVCLSFLVKGEMIFQIDSKNDEISYEENESFMVYIERLSGTLKVYEGKPFKEVKVIVSNSFLQRHGLDEPSEFKKITDKNLILPINHNMFSVIDALQKEYGQGLVKRLYLGAKVIEIIALQMENYKTFSVNNVEIFKKKNIKKLFVLKQFLKDNLNQNYAISELANEVGLSENILKSEFKRIFNCSINQYFLEQKMERAKLILLNSERPIYEIAEIVGYKNATHFSAAFKRFYNKTPKTCRGKL